MHGKGTSTWPNGRKYIGEYVDNKKSGYGEYFWPDGRCYRGEWLNGLQHGKGVFVTSSGQEKYGEWVEAKIIRWIVESDGDDAASNPEQ